MTELHPVLAAALAERYPGYEATAGAEGLAKLQEQFDDWRGPERIDDLGDWIGRRRYELHPAYGLPATERCLPGRQKHGVKSASIETVRGRDGRWYGAASFFVHSIGHCGPVGDPPFATEREALEHHAASVRRSAESVIAGHYPESCQRDARKIVEWLDEQLRGQGDLFA